jgi:hypothetical protein
VDPKNQEAKGPLRKKEGQGVVADNINTPKVNPKGGHTVAQFHPPPGSIRGLGWMN